MNVLHVIEGLDPSKGGPSVSCPSLACAQTASCDEVGILTYDLDEETFYNLELPNQDQLALFSIRGGSLEKLFGFNARKALRRLITDYGVVHIHGIWSQLAAEACKYAKRAGIPYVIAPRGMLDPWSLRQRRLKKQLALTLKWRSILDNAHFIHALNDDEARLIGKLGLKSRVRVSPNGIFVEKLQQLKDVDGSDCRARYGEYILFMSRLHYKKGLDFLIQGYSEYLKRGGTARLVIAGPDEGEKSKTLALIDRLGIQASVSMIGPVYGQAKYQLLRGAKVFCLPSRQEGFSMAIIEAAAAGVPVVISTHCHFDEIAQAGAGDVIELDAEAIGGSLYKYAAFNTDAGQRGSELIRKKYIWETIAPKLVDWYR